MNLIYLSQNKHHYSLVNFENFVSIKLGEFHDRVEPFLRS
jgi:hypothetical protein